MTAGLLAKRGLIMGVANERSAPGVPLRRRNSAELPTYQMEGSAQLRRWQVRRL